MRILFITRKFPPSVGGMENFAYDLYSSLSKIIDTKLIKWGGSSKYLPIVLPYFFVVSAWNLLTNKIDVVHVHDGLLSPLGYVLSKLFRKPFTVVIHGLDITYKNKFYQLIVPRMVKRADVVFCNSKATADEAIKRGVLADKTFVIPLGITDDHFKFKGATTKILNKAVGEDISNRLIIATVGRLVKRKGVAWFTNNVMPRLVEKHPEVLYLVAGDGEDRENIQEVIEQKGLQHNVKLLGRVEDSVISALYNRAHVFVMPNIPVEGDIEGFGRVLLEASLCELPVVASGIEGIKDAVTDGKNGMLVESQDAEAFVVKVTKFLEDKRYSERFGKSSRQYTLSNYQWANIAKRYVKIYKEIKH